MRRPVSIVAAAAFALALACQPTGAEAQAGPIAESTQKLSLKPHRIKGKLLGYGYSVGEFTGEMRGQASSKRLQVYESDGSKTVFTFASPARPEPITVSCAGGESHMQLGWIQFNTHDVSYLCRFENGPPDAAFELALGEGSVMQRLQQPQRAAHHLAGRVVQA